ncbi:hypothetical protein Bbelb_182310 [Branchiostoma belcheri]|nr:hypothetical protein Bbelb_182310 [Branchiostoma belcheri]
MNSSVLVGTAQATKYASIFEGRSAGECRTLCGTSLGRVRDVLRESAIRSAGECGTSSGRVRYVLRESAVRPAGECGTFCGRVRYVQRESAVRSAGECGTSSGRVRYVLRESAVRPAGECGTFCGSQTFCSSLLEQRKYEISDFLCHLWSAAEMNECRDRRGQGRGGTRRVPPVIGEVMSGETRSGYLPARAGKQRRQALHMA